MKPSAWAAVALGLLITVPVTARAQQNPAGAVDLVQLGRNYPNPFNPETTIPFTLNEALWAGGQDPVVSLRIYNILAQLVAVPILQGSGEPLDNMRLAWNGTGNYTAYWDGKVLNTGREAASGVYIYQIVVNGNAVSKKMTIVK